VCGEDCGVFAGSRFVAEIEWVVDKWLDKTHRGVQMEWVRGRKAIIWNLSYSID
jgi:hypothetical protein